MEKWMESMQQVYACLGDDESKRLFECRVMYALTKDAGYVEQMYADIPEKKKLDQRIQICKELKDQAIYYGAGNDLHIMKSLYSELEISCLCDRDAYKQAHGWEGIPVISPEELLEMKEKVYVVIVTTGFHTEIKRFLLAGGFKEERIIDLGEILEPLYHRQYFDASVMKRQEEGVFVDGGCYDCGTSLLFTKWCEGKYAKIYAFEPDQSNYLKCLDRSGRIPGMKVFHKGLWNCEEELTFAEEAGQGSRITGGMAGNVSIVTTEIDRIVKDERVTFIKLDVEGAELKALQGAKNTILNNHPRLAVSIYHKPEDIFEIPEYILSLHKDYVFYIRHYQFSECETILYAI